MTRSIKTIASLFTLIVMSATTAQVNADDYHHIDRLAVKIQKTSKQLLRESVHYRHTPEYRHMVADANEMYRLATHVHEVSHFEGNLRHLQNDVANLDRQFHHVESVFDRIERNAAYGNGHVHGRTAHVKRLLISIQDSIHHMQVDLKQIRNRNTVSRRFYNQPVLHQVYGGNYGGHGGRVHGNGVNGHTRYGSNTGGFGFSIGRGNSRINIRF
jgi:hypothetical protein